jgi:hypothetical protein
VAATIQFPDALSIRSIARAFAAEGAPPLAKWKVVTKARV